MVATYSNEPSFQPLYLFSDCIEDGTTTRRLMVTILSPIGVSVGNFWLVYPRMDKLYYLMLRGPIYWLI